MARPELGFKRQCMSCGAKFYDLARDPATCPKCGTIFQGASAVAPSRVAAPAVANRTQREEEEEEVETTDAETVSLEEVEAAESSTETTAEDSDDEEAAASDDTFLEEDEEGDDDVADLIDGDIENDEES